MKLLIDKQAVTRKPTGDEFIDKSGFTFDPFTTQLKYRTEEPTSAGAVRPLSDGRHDDRCGFRLEGQHHHQDMELHRG